MRKIVFLSSFFAFTPVLLFLSILYFLFLSYNQKNSSKFLSSNLDSVSFAALPSFENSILNQIEEKDSRVELVRQFFERYRSPLEPYAQNIVSAADKHNIDFRLLPAIAMQESNLCQKIPKNSYNCWGFGIYGKTMTMFGNYSEAIETVSKAIAKDYVNKGLDTAQEIMKKYTPSNNGAWANSVNYFINSLNYPI